MCGYVADTGNRRQVLELPSKGFQGVAHARLQIAHTLTELLHLGQVELEEEAMVIGDPSTQRLDNGLPARLESTAAQRDKLLGIFLARDNRIDDCVATSAERVADRARDLDVRVLEDLLDPVLVLRREMCASSFTDHLSRAEVRLPVGGPGFPS